MSDTVQHAQRGAAGVLLDVPQLLEASLPRGRGAWFWYAAGAFVLLILTATYLSRQSAEMEALVRLTSMVLLFVVILVMAAVTFAAVRRHRGEQQQLEAIEELVQLRRWEDAAGMLQQLLSRPLRTPQSRAQGLIYLAAVLARFNRFADAIDVQEHLLEHDLDASTAYGIRLGRAMALLRDDRLLDADRAIIELRRSADGRDSGGLALVEIYRDVKTGHPEEAIALYEQKLPAMRRQLGHRLADPHALAARAYQMLGNDDAAQQAYERATLLSCESELERKYPELAPLKGQLRAAEPPTEVPWDR